MIGPDEIENYMKQVFELIQTGVTKRDSQWDRDARRFSAVLLEEAKTEDEARRAARLGAAAADELEKARATKAKLETAH